MLEFRHVSVRLDGKQILDRVSFCVRPHRLTVLVGRNGSGKSTLLSCVNQQLPYTGQILDGEKDLARLRARERAGAVAILPQMLPAPHLFSEEVVAFGRNPHLDFTGRLTAQDRAVISDALLQADAQALTGRYVDTLSGGERQRVALAMILAQNTPIALLDEPTAHLDQSYEAAFLRTLVRLKTERKKTFLVVLHDLTTAVRYADDLVVLDQGRLLYAGTKEACLEQCILEDTFQLKRYTAEDQIFFLPK